VPRAQEAEEASARKRRALESRAKMLAEMSKRQNKFSHAHERELKEIDKEEKRHQVWSVLFETVWQTLFETLWQSLFETLWHSLLETLWHSLLETLWQILFETFWQTLFESVANLFETVWQTSLESVAKLGGNLCSNLCSIIFVSRFAEYFNVQPPAPPRATFSNNLKFGKIKKYLQFFFLQLPKTETPDHKSEAKSVAVGLSKTDSRWRDKL
jgi:hypothetical protein